MDNIIILGNESILAEGISKKIAEYEKALKDDLVINYVAPTDRIAFDSARFKKENPDMYDEYLKISPVKSSIRIKVK